MALDEAALLSTPTLTRTWGQRGIQPIVPTLNQHRQRITLIGTVNLENGELFDRVAEKGNIITFLEFLRKLLKKYPKKKIYIILDNVRFHHANKVTKEFLPRVKRVEFIYLPPYSPNLNPKEWVWKQLRRETTHNSYYPEFHDEIEAAKRFLKSYTLPTKELLCRIIY